MFLVWVRRRKKNNPTKFDKIPYYATNGYLRHGENGCPQDRAELVGFDNAVAAFRRGPYDGIGMALLADVTDWALDLDDCVDADGGLSALARRVVDSGTYCESSPSGSGVRALFAGKAGINAKNHKVGVEIFDSRGFVTVTGERIGGAALLPCPPVLLDQLIAIVGPEKCRKVITPGIAIPNLENTNPPHPVQLPPWLRRRLVAPYPEGCDRSCVAYLIALELKHCGVTAAQALELMSTPAVLEPALERRGGDIESARSWMWHYVITPVYRRGT